MKEWYAPTEIAEMGLADMPNTKRGINKMARDLNWQKSLNSLGEPLTRERNASGGGSEYHYSLLPLRAQQALVAQALARRPSDSAPVIPNNASEAWAWFERLPEKRKATARGRLEAIEAVETLASGGICKNVAVATVAHQRKTSGSTLYNWFDLVSGIARVDRLPSLAPRHAGRTKSVACDPRAWEFLKADYLRLSAPSFTSCFDRLFLAAREHGWSIPSARTLVRRLEHDIPAAVTVLCREGQEALKRMYPAQERDRSMLHALEAVNADGHKWDVFVQWPDGEIGRPMMVAVQDLYSNKFLAWRVARSENADSVRLTFGDVFRRFGIPDRAYLDNGRGFASKWITGGTPNRYRFKVKPEEPSGVLTALGVEVHWTRPYSGQSKPIERAFRDFCDAIAKHPAFEGAYTGNKPDAKPENYGSRAIPIETFLKIVDQGIRLHNAKPKRNTRVCRRRLSFDEAFTESYERALIRKANREQLRLCMLAAESVRADRQSGALRVLGNRYWAECLHDHMGQALAVRFDPDRLHDGVEVYRLDGSYIGAAACIEAVGFEDTTAARDHARELGRFKKATKEAARIERTLSLDQLVALLPEVDEPETPAAAAVRPIFGNLAAAARVADADPEPNEDPDVAFFKKFSAGLRLVEGGLEE